MAHARVSAVELFEAALREQTPLASINDPKAFVEYLNQLNLKGEMVLDELKKVSNDKDTIQKKLNGAEEDARKAWDEVASLKAAKEHAPESAEKDDSEQEKPEPSPDPEEAKTEPAKEAETPKSPPLSGVFNAGKSLFSPRTKPVDTAGPNEEAEELFSYDNEVPRLETELKERQQQVTSLEK